MLILHHGHSEFLLETADGFRILTDPYDAHVGYPMTNVACDAVTISHGHGDHCFAEKAQGSIVIADEAGATRLSSDVKALGIPSFHDECEGKKRGKNLVFIIEAEGLRVAHLGDLGAWDDALIEAIGYVDILLVPVGGYYTIDAASAAALCKRLAPRVVIPMHYKTEANADWPIAPVNDFLALMNAQDAPQMPLLRITKEDLSEHPPLIVLQDHQK